MDEIECEISFTMLDNIVESRSTKEIVYTSYKQY